jgi:hypothetical protein
MIFLDSQLIIVMHDVIWWSNSFATLVYNMEFLSDFNWCWNISPFSKLFSCGNGVIFYATKR